MVHYGMNNVPNIMNNEEQAESGEWKVELFYSVGAQRKQTTACIQLASAAIGMLYFA